MFLGSSGDSVSACIHGSHKWLSTAVLRVLTKKNDHDDDCKGKAEDWIGGFNVFGQTDMESTKEEDNDAPFDRHDSFNRSRYSDRRGSKLECFKSSEATVFSLQYVCLKTAPSKNPAFRNKTTS